jgi:tetratricopeptide (TPR) repeat protein
LTVSAQDTATLRRAVQLYQAGDLNNAATACAIYLQSQPDDHRAHQLMALIRHDLNDPDGAVSHIDRAIALAPGIAGYQANKGAIMYAHGKPDAALDAYAKARDLDPSLDGVDTAIGLLCDALERPKQAADAYRRALAANPADISLHLNLGKALRETGNFQDAMECFATLTLLQPDNADGYYNLAIVQQDVGDHENAIVNIRRAMELVPDFAAYHLALARSARATADTALEQASYRTALRLDPDGESFHLQRVVTDIEDLLARGNYARADQRIRQAMSEFPIVPWWSYFRAAIALRLGLGDAARRWIDIARRRSVDCEPVRFLALEEKLAALEGNLADLPPAAPLPHPSYLLIKCWGYGFWSDVSHVLSSLLMGEITGRIPVIHWGSNSYYTDTPETDAFSSFFLPPSDITLAELASPDFRYFPHKWNAGNLQKECLDIWSGEGARKSGIYLLHRPEQVVVSDFYTQLSELLPWLEPEHPLYGKSVRDAYHDLYHRHFRLQPDVQAEVDAFIRPNFGGRPTLGVHIRNIDKGLENLRFEEDRAQILPTVERILEQQPDMRIFLMTDTTAALEEWRRRFGDRVFNAECARTDSEVPLTWRSDVGSHRRLGVEVIRDTYAAAACDQFIGLGCTNVVGMVTILKRWRDEDLHIIGEVSLLRENWLLHDW